MHDYSSVYNANWRGYSKLNSKYYWTPEYFKSFEAQWMSIDIGKVKRIKGITT